MSRKNQWYEASMHSAPSTSPRTLPNAAERPMIASFLRLISGSGNICTRRWYADGIAAVRKHPRIYSPLTHGAGDSAESAQNQEPVLGSSHKADHKRQDTEDDEPANKDVLGGVQVAQAPREEKERGEGERVRSKDLLSESPCYRLTHTIWETWRLISPAICATATPTPEMLPEPVSHIQPSNSQTSTKFATEKMARRTCLRTLLSCASGCCAGS